MARRQTYEGLSLAEAVRVLADGHYEARTRHISADEHQLLLQAADVLDREHASLRAFP
ncbi:MAG: hypothetical protein ACR2K0_03735 [Acidimicrobiales bacterium]